MGLPTMIEADQIRAARGFLAWSQTELAERAKVSVQTIKRLENLGTGASSLDTVRAVMTALQAGGCTFLADDGKGRGVRAKTDKGKSK